MDLAPTSERETCLVPQVQQEGVLSWGLVPPSRDAQDTIPPSSKAGV